MGRRVAIYARVSTEHEAQISALGNQIQYYDEKLKQHPDWTLVERYIDEGITGTSIHKRPNFLRMLKDAESGKFDLIVTREVSRFARNTVDTLQETRKLKKMGVEVYFTEDNIWTFKDDDGELKLTIMATLAQNESKKISQRVKAGQQITFQNGVFYGNGNILGYDKVGKDMVINEEQAKTVRLIFDLYLKGYGSKKIKYELEKLGRVTSTGLNRWSESYIIRVLRNSFYCGTIVYRKQFVPDYLEQKHKKNNGEVEQVIVEGRHTPIISKEVFEKVQEKLKDNAKLIVSSNTSRGIGNRGKESIWGKKLVCKCGSSFNRKIYHKHKDGNTWCYQCYKQIQTGTIQTRLNKGLSIEGICDSKMIPEWKLNMMSQRIFDTIWKDKDVILEITNNYLDNAIKKINDEDDPNELDLLRKRKDNINGKLNRLLDSYLNEIISKDDFVEKRKELEKEIKDVNELITELEKKPVAKNTLIDKLNSLKKNIEVNLNFDKDRISDELIDALVKKIIVFNNRFEWKLNIYDKMEEEEDSTILIAKFVFTKDDIQRYTKENNILVKKYEEFYVDLYI
jgi:DNA invertase Pin-like site-specific DNA recombinase